MRSIKGSKKAKETAAFMHLFNSARCNEIANQVIAAFERKYVSYELIASDSRINFSTGKQKDITDEQFMPYMAKLFTSGKKAIYPTKVSAKQVKAMFPDIKTAGSEDVRDAIMLMAPEVLYHKIKEKLARG